MCWTILPLSTMSDAALGAAQSCPLTIHVKHEGKVQFVAEDGSVLFDVLVSDDGLGLRITAPDECQVGDSQYGGVLVIEPRTNNSVDVSAKFRRKAE